MVRADASSASVYVRSRVVLVWPDMQRIPPVIQNAGNRLFWDVDPATLDPERHADFILGRVLSEGDWEMVRALRREVGDSALRAFLERAPHRLDARTRCFLHVVLPASESSSRPEASR
jgi:hypothetical protein